MSKERPILFSAPMVRALLDGSKTQTRRVVKMPPSWDCFVCADFGAGWWPYASDDGESPTFDNNEVPMVCPYGRPGDRLWVREAVRLMPDQEPDDGTGSVLSIYNADGALTVADAWPWKRRYLPPMHCPRGLSRILLEIISVRVELLTDISYDDAVAEGIQHKYPKAIAQYRELWESINGADSWLANPWVWVIEFKRVQP